MLQVELKFISKLDQRTVTLGKKVRECVDWSEALRFAAATLDRSTPEDVARVTDVRLRVVMPAPVDGAPLPFAMSESDG